MDSVIRGILVRKVALKIPAYHDRLRQILVYNIDPGSAKSNRKVPAGWSGIDGAKHTDRVFYGLQADGICRIENLNIWRQHEALLGLNGRDVFSGRLKPISVDTMYKHVDLFQNRPCFAVSKICIYFNI